MEHSVIDRLSMTRSVLNPVAPIGVGTPEVESMVSYFCRLAMSHCISAAELFRFVAEAMERKSVGLYKWNLLYLSGMSETTANWASTLSKLTSVERLDFLTLLTWRDVVAHSSPSDKSSSCWCPQCFEEDRATGLVPYFRLAWDVGTVTACAKHEVRLARSCPHCGRTGARHNSAYVVPGWCTFCGGFLGGIGESPPATTGEIWIACQIGAMVAAQSTLASIPTRQALLYTIRELVDRLDNGKSALFARRVGLSKTTIHHWLNNGGTPRLPGLLRIASQSGLTLPALLTGDLSSSLPVSIEIQDLESILPNQKSRAPRKFHDWDHIRDEMVTLIQSPTVTSVAQAARNLNVDLRELYKNANEEARALGKRWIEHRKYRGEQSRKATHELIESAYAEISSEGKSVNLRELLAHLPDKSPKMAQGVFAILQEVKSRKEIC
jgi:DNA-binding phage protein